MTNRVDDMYAEEYEGEVESMPYQEDGDFEECDEDGDPGELKENEDFAQDNLDMGEDDWLDGSYEE